MAKIEVVYYRHFAVYAQEVDSIEEAIAYIESGEDAGSMSSVGVFVGGDPVIYDGYLDTNMPTADEYAAMRQAYAKVER